MNYSDLIGPAGKVGKILHGITPRLKGASRAGGITEKPAFLLCGPPGVGKSTLAGIFAKDLAEDPLAITEVSGKNVNIETVRQWLNNIGLGSLFGDWQVRWIEELDTVPRDAQDLLLHYLDKLPPKCAFIGTSNLQLDLLQERFQTRLRTWKILQPTTEEIAAHLVKVSGIDLKTANQIAFASAGNVRAAELDAQSAQDAQLIAA
jgi:DNA polymerase III delta prime subunit